MVTTCWAEVGKDREVNLVFSGKATKSVIVLQKGYFCYWNSLPSIHTISMAFLASFVAHLEQNKRYIFVTFI